MGGPMTISAEVKAAFEEAKRRIKNSHAPYSKLNVVAALKVKAVDEVVCGVNVENASYGATICAERSAFCSAVSEFGSANYEFIVIISTAPGEPIPPCGMCLQVLQEFVGKDFPIYLGDTQALHKKFLLSELVPHGFSKDMLPE